MQGGGMQIMTPQFTPMVKKLIYANVGIWLFFVLIVQQFFMDSPYIFNWFGLIPIKVITDFFVWQPFTYMFLHSNNIFHVVLNMLLLWWMGADLESRWGSRFFLTYYMVCGIGAALIYLLVVTIYYFVTKNSLPMQVPVVGASGAVFGILLAYGMIFGERIIYFMMIFPMKAKYFVILTGGIELVSLLSAGFGSSVANLAHLGGIVVGYLFLRFYTKWQHKRVRKRTSKHGRNLKLVVDNESKNPRYWN